jgi:hypothetical protein
MLKKRNFKFERVLEQFEIPLLEVVSCGRTLYVRKWATPHVWLYVRVTKRLVEKYMRGGVSLYDLLGNRRGVIEVEIDSTLWRDYLRASLGALPPRWLPHRSAYHDKDLRPEAPAEKS